MQTDPADEMASTGRPLQVVVVCPTFGGYGGMEAFTLALLRQLRPLAGLDVRVCFKRTRGFALRPGLAEAVRPEGGRVEFVDRASRALWRALRAADVVHAQNASPDVVLAARLLRRPLLVHLHNRRLPGHSPGLILWDFCVRQADARFYVSEFVRRTWEGGAPGRRSRVVHSVSELPVGERPPAQRRGFVFAARWIENKGLEVLVDAYAQAGLDPGRSPLCLLGDGPLRTRVLHRIAALGVRGIAAPGFVAPADKAEAIRSARWMVVPPHTHEDFGLTAIEARAVGVPCIATRDGGVPEAAGAEALLCEPRDVPGLAACLRRAEAMSEAEYAARSRRTRETLAAQLVGPEFYAAAYRGLARTS